jgi:hypothetical protein
VESALEWITERVMTGSTGDEDLTPQALSFLLRRYATTGRADLGELLGTALARALDRYARPAPDDRRAGDAPDQAGAEEWLIVFIEAAGLSEDARLWPVAASLTASLTGGWPSRRRFATALRGVEACLFATQLDPPAADVQTAIDELERIVGSAYVPGDGLANAMNGGQRSPGDLIDHVAAASALLTAYGIAGRLPYSMLAEELMQFARRSWWNERRGGFHAPMPSVEAGTSEVDRSTAPVERRQTNDLFAANCEAARVLCRLAALHRDQDYRHAAVIAEQSDYVGDAGRTLESLVDGYRASGADVALYGLALVEHETLLRSD